MNDPLYTKGEYVDVVNLAGSVIAENIRILDVAPCHRANRAPSWVYELSDGRYVSALYLRKRPVNQVIPWNACLFVPSEARHGT